MYPNLQAEMARRNIDRKDIADLLNVTLITLNRKMSGEYQFTVDQAKKIKAFLGVVMSLDELFEFTEVE